jgi:hypothetical protein
MNSSPDMLSVRRAGPQVISQYTHAAKAKAMPSPNNSTANGAFVRASLVPSQ